MVADAYTAGVLMLAAVVFAMAGFGYALVAVPLLSLIMPIPDAVAMQFPFCMALVVLNAWRYRSRISWRALLPLIAGAALTQPLGMLSLTRLPGHLMKRALALFIVFAVACNRLEPGKRLSGGWARGAWWGGAMGLLSGWFSGAYTTGGPPAVIYVMARAEDPGEAKALMGAYFSFLDLGVMVMYLWAGLLTGPGLARAAIFSPAVVAGMLLGGWAARHIGMGAYRLAVDLLLMLSASLLWILA